MESEILTGLVSFLTATAGMLGAPLDDIGQNGAPHESHNHDHSGENGSNLELGSAHKHAQFFLNVDGEEVNFTQRRYQLRSNYVHLENFKPHIVHKHSENVTWGMFLETIDVKVERGNQSCVSFKGRNECGDLSVVLNGEEADLDKEIGQGDNLAILLDSENLSVRYMNEKLPNDYTKQAYKRTV